MTKKQLEKQRKEYYDFVANMESYGGRELTEDELRLKINGGEGETENRNSEDESEDGVSTPSIETDNPSTEEPTVAEDEAQEEFGKDDKTESTTQSEAKEEDDGKSLVETIWDAIVEFFTGGSKDDDKAEHKDDDSENTEDKENSTIEKSTNDEKESGASSKTESNDENGNATVPADKTETEKTESSDPAKSDGGGFWDSLCSVFSAIGNFFEDIYDGAKEIVNDIYEYFLDGGVTLGIGSLEVKSSERTNLNFTITPSSDTRTGSVIQYNTKNPENQSPYDFGTQENIANHTIYNNEYSSLPRINPSGKASVTIHLQ